MSLFYRWGLRSHNQKTVTCPVSIESKLKPRSFGSGFFFFPFNIPSSFKCPTWLETLFMILFLHLTPGKLLEHLEEMDFLWGIPTSPLT